MNEYQAKKTYTSPQISELGSLKSYILDHDQTSTYTDGGPDCNRNTEDCFYTPSNI